MNVGQQGPDHVVRALLCFRPMAHDGHDGHGRTIDPDRLHAAESELRALLSG